MSVLHRRKSSPHTLSPIRPHYCTLPTILTALFAVKTQVPEPLKQHEDLTVLRSADPGVIHTLKRDHSRSVDVEKTSDCMRRKTILVAHFLTLNQSCTVCSGRNTPHSHLILFIYNNNTKNVIKLDKI